MEEVHFIFNDIKTILKCQKEQYFKDISLQFANIMKIDINSVYFLYEGTKINTNLKLNEITQLYDNKNNHIIINVENIINNKNLYYSKDVICPKCNKKSRNIKCNNGHNINEEIKEFRKKIDEFNSSINEIIKILKKVIEIVENFYSINFASIKKML